MLATGRARLGSAKSKEVGSTPSASSEWPASQLAWTLASQARKMGSKPMQVTMAD